MGFMTENEGDLCLKKKIKIQKTFSNLNRVRLELIGLT